MAAKTTVKFEGAGLLPALRVKDKKGNYQSLELKSGKASFQATLGDPYKLFWLVVGEPGSKYKITLSTSSANKVVSRRHPISGVVPSGSAGYGREKFVVKKKTTS